MSTFWHYQNLYTYIPTKKYLFLEKNILHEYLDSSESAVSIRLSLVHSASPEKHILNVFVKMFRIN